jgi:hypothetical protein
MPAEGAIARVVSACTSPIHGPIPRDDRFFEFNEYFPHTVRTASDERPNLMPFTMMCGSNKNKRESGRRSGVGQFRKPRIRTLENSVFSSGFV